MNRSERNERIVDTREQFRMNVGKAFWKAPVDIATTKSQVLHRGSNTIPVIIPPHAIPPMRHLTPDALYHVAASMRSRYAQLGLEPAEDIGYILGQSFDGSAKRENDGSVIKPFEAHLPIVNHSTRKVIIDQNILRLYSDWASIPIRGEELYEKVRSREIDLDGHENEDWKWIYKKRNGHKDINNIVGIDIKIQPGSGLWIPPDSTNSIIKISSTLPTYRDEIRNLQKPIPQTDEEILWTGRVQIRLGKSVEGIITEKIAEYVEASEALEDKQEVLRSGRHIHSLLIDSGTNWGNQGVIVEIKSATTPHQIPLMVPFRFAQAA